MDEPIRKVWTIENIRVERMGPNIIVSKIDMMRSIEIEVFDLTEDGQSTRSHISTLAEFVAEVGPYMCDEDWLGLSGG